MNKYFIRYWQKKKYVPVQICCIDPLLPGVNQIRPHHHHLLVIVYLWLCCCNHNPSSHTPLCMESCYSDNYISPCIHICTHTSPNSILCLVLVDLNWSKASCRQKTCMDDFFWSFSKSCVVKLMNW